MKIELFGREISIYSPAQWEKVKGLWAKYFLHPAVVFVFALLAVCFVAYGVAHRRGNRVGAVRLKKALPPVYLLLIVSLALLNRLPGSGGRGWFHLLPDYIFAGTVGVHETRLLMAIFDFLYYVPYGFLLRWALLRRGRRAPFLLASATGLLVEICQWLFGLGVGTVEHWLLYSLGATAGIAAFDACRKRLTKAPRGSSACPVEKPREV